MTVKHVKTPPRCWPRTWVPRCFGYQRHVFVFLSTQLCTLEWNLSRRSRRNTVLLCSLARQRCFAILGGRLLPPLAFLYSFPPLLSLPPLFAFPCLSSPIHPVNIKTKQKLQNPVTLVKTNKNCIWRLPSPPDLSAQ